MELKVLAPAKINLCLDVVRKRPDGYHDIETIMQSISLYDTITVTDTQSGDITISCSPVGSVPCNEKNIAYKAATQFFRYTQTINKGIHIHIDKVIPSQAGMGGGSSDGAGVILALNKLYETYLKEKEMLEICEKVGADVPFCLVGGTRYANGTGTTMQKTHKLPKCKIVICKPDVSVSTAEAYQKTDSMPPKVTVITELAMRSLYSGSMSQICATLYNDFEVALKLPEVNNIKQIMYKCKAKGASMTGSGSAVFGIFGSDNTAQKCADILKQTYNEVFIAEPTKDGCKII